MSATRRYLLIAACGVLLLFGSSCSIFGPKYGCPGNGKNVGAEKIISGDKVPKARKFKS